MTYVLVYSICVFSTLYLHLYRVLYCKCHVVSFVALANKANTRETRGRSPPALSPPSTSPPSRVSFSYIIALTPVHVILGHTARSRQTSRSPHFS